VGTIDDKRVVLVSLDIWSDHFDVRSAMLFPHHLSTHAPGPRPLWEAWDDAGTTYRSEGWSGGARKQWVLRHDGFRPAPPPEASALTLALMRSDGRQVGERTVTLKRRSATRRSR
jgi:hypothetical protein